MKEKRVEVVSIIVFLVRVVDKKFSLIIFIIIASFRDIVFVLLIATISISISISIALTTSAALTISHPLHSLVSPHP